MKQVLQNLKTGEIEVAEVPQPALRPHHLLVRSRRSLISVGTERASVSSGKASLLDRARRNPERVLKVIDQVRREGIGAAVAQVQTALERLAPLGYSNVGEVVAVGEGVAGFHVGQRVASNGPHAELVAVPANLCQKVPDGVDDDAAALTVLGAIALQGVRLAAPALGETFAVSGLGLVGLLAVQLLRAAGCRVVGLDFSAARLELARRFGAETVDLNLDPDPAATCRAIAGGRGVDGVVIAAATDSDAPLRQAADMARVRGRIVLVGVIGETFSREAFYRKELTFQVSCSYGPGRYDPAYEEGGQDYPVGFVRWTARRNFEAVLDMLADGRLDAGPLIERRLPLAEAPEAYAGIGGGALGLVFEYPAAADVSTATVVPLPAGRRSARPLPAGPTVGVIGAGAYATGTLLPALQAEGARFATIVGRDGARALRVARRFGFANAASAAEAVLDDPAIDLVVVATPHDSHAGLVAAALRAGKHVFVEKPLAIDRAGLDDVAAALHEAPGSPLLMVGFNRRFSPHVVRLKELLDGRPEPKAMVMTVNAGATPSGHWVGDPAVSGGRLVGEGCHFVDLLAELAGSPAVSVAGRPLRDDPDCFGLTIGFADGSLATLHYLTNGHGDFPKERLEVFCGGRIVRIDNFERLEAFGFAGERGLKTRAVDKGNRACIAAFVAALRGGGPPPASPESLLASSALTLRAAAAVSAGGAVPAPPGPP